MLSFVSKEGYFLVDGREIYLSHGQPRLYFRHLLDHKGQWITWERLAAVGYGYDMPLTARYCVSMVMGKLVRLLAHTTAQIERRQGYGYRLTGDIEVR